MEVRDFECNDLIEIEEWIMERNLSSLKISDLPKNGSLISKNGKSIAAGFIRKCEGDMVIFDSMITNPKESPENRNEAMDLLYETLLKKTMANGFNRVLGFSVDNNTIVRSKKFGFKELNHKVLTLTFREHL